MHEDAYQCEVGSDIFRRVCVELNSTVLDSNAKWSVEIRSGGVRFSDEIPVSIKSSDELQLPAVTLFRRLWAYRQSLLLVEPRADLEPTWTAVKRSSPNWVGFTPNRCSREHGQIYVEATAEALEKFDRENQKYDSYPKANESDQAKSMDALQVTGTK